MDTRLARETIDVIRREQRRRDKRLPDHPDAAYDQWMFRDLPFVNDLCLTFLVAIHHQVERELVFIAARMTGDGHALSGDDYRVRVREERERWRTKKTQKKVIARLGLNGFPEWNASLEALRQIANCYKHAPWNRPDDDLLKHVGLPLNRNYAPLPDSPGFLDGLAVYLGLAKDSDYCDVAEEFLRLADSFLLKVGGQPGMSKVEWGFVSSNPDDAEW